MKFVERRIDGLFTLSPPTSADGMPTELWPLLLSVGGGFAVVGKSTIFFEGFICNFGIWVSWDMFMGFLDALKLFYRLTTEASRDTLNSQAKSTNL